MYKFHQGNARKYIVIFLLVWIVAMVVFVSTSIGAENYRILLNSRRYFIVAIVVTISIFFWQKIDLKNKQLLPYIIIGISWLLIHNLTSFISYRNVVTNLNNYMDIAFSGYIFSFLVLLRILVFCLARKDTKFIDFIFACIQFIVIFIPLAELLYFLYYGTTISTAAGIAILQTNPNEAKEFLLQNIGLLGIAGICVTLFFIIAFFMYQNSKVKHRIYGFSFQKGLTSKNMLMIFILLVGIGAYLPKCWAGTGVAHSMLGAKHYLDDAREFTTYHTEQLNNLSVTPNLPQFDKPSTIILVIGESAGRNFMSVYGYQANDTTPWLRDSVENTPGNFLRFNHAYSSYGSTMQALERALTEKNQYNDKEFSKSLTLLDLAKKAGYKTYWFSNQSVKNTADNPVQLVARTADVTRWVDDEPDARNRINYDGDLLPFLRDVNPNENNFIVIHVMGSHELTIHRFPPEFTRFGEEGVFDLVSNYEDSMAYDDWVLQQIFLYAQKNLNLQAMVFFSDHGANPYRKRVADNIPFINFRIPLIIYLSDEYKKLYPETTNVLISHEDQYFTNDLMYELVGGILNIKSDHLNEKNNFADPSYQYTRETLKTDLGRKSLTEDLDENKIEK